MRSRWQGRVRKGSAHPRRWAASFADGRDMLVPRASGGASARCGVSGGTSVGRTVSSWTECPSASGRRYRVHSEKLKVLPYDIYVSACFNSRNSLSCK